MTDKNILLGKNELLTQDILPRPAGRRKSYPYTFEETIVRLSPMISDTVSAIEELPAKACAAGMGLVALTMHPEFLAQSYYPASVLNDLGLRVVGSRAKEIVPLKRSRNRVPERVPTTELLAMGSRENIRTWPSILDSIKKNSRSGRELTRIEEIIAPTAESKISGTFENDEIVKLEVVLHANQTEGEKIVLPELREYLKGFSLNETFKRRFYVKGLTYVGIEAPANLISQIAMFTAIRVVRRMAKIRELRPIYRSRAHLRA